jgi:hypothetical protein
MGSPLLSMSFVKQLTILIGFGVYLRAGYAAGHQKNPNQLYALDEADAKGALQGL